jgi:hypothetical protein
MGNYIENWQAKSRKCPDNKPILKAKATMHLYAV